MHSICRWTEELLRAAALLLLQRYGKRIKDFTLGQKWPQNQDNKQEGWMVPPYSYSSFLTLKACMWLGCLILAIIYQERRTTSTTTNVSDPKTLKNLTANLKTTGINSPSASPPSTMLFSILNQTPFPPLSLCKASQPPFRCMNIFKWQVITTTTAAPISPAAAASSFT